MALRWECVAFYSVGGGRQSDRHLLRTCITLTTFREGIVMLVDIAEERGGSQIDAKWADPERCNFPILSLVQPLYLRGMSCVYFAMWMGNQWF